MSQFIDMFKNIPSVKIADCCITVSGGTPNTKKIEYYDGGDIPWLSSGEINQGYIFSTDKYITQLGLENSSAKWIPANSVVIAMYGATAGKVGFIKIPLTTNQAVCTLLPNDGFEPLYLYYATLSKTSWMISQCRGAAQPNISQSIIRSMEIPMATIDEQKQFCKLLTQADKSKFGDFKSQFIEMFGNTSKEMLGKFIQVVRGVSYKPSDVKTADDPDTAVILRSNNINDANLNTDEVVYINKNRVSGDQYLRVNDIVVCASNGSKALVGKAAINKTLTNQYAHGAFCLLVRPNDNINPVYLNTFFQTSLYKKQIDELAAGSNILNIKQEYLTNMILPLPIIEEQNKFAIIAEQADKSKSYVRIALKNLESILGYCIRQVA